MSLRQTLEDFMGQIAMATTDAPDEYLLAQQGYENVYEIHKSDMKSLWAQIRPQLRRDVERAEWVDIKLQEMFSAFDAGDKETGRKAAWALYNADVSKLR